MPASASAGFLQIFWRDAGLGIRGLYSIFWRDAGLGIRGLSSGSM